MTKHEKSLPSRIVIFVEGDTDELLFKALLD
jgi:predicted ATP-dependent endonuclease of OLD family